MVRASTSSTSTAAAEAVETTVVVGRIGRAHGVKGEVSVEPRTDEPERRFAVGNALTSRTPDGALRSWTVAGTRWHSGRLLVRFAELPDRTAAEAANGTVLELVIDGHELPEDPEEFYDHQLIGLRVESEDGEALGTVASVVHGPLQDLLVISRDGGEALVPFVSELVPVVDLAARRVVVSDRPGLLTGEAEQ